MITRKEVDNIIDVTLKDCRNTLISKQGEYAVKSGLHNFEVGSRITGKTREEVLWGFALKHFISILDIREGIKEGKLPTREQVDEKYGDLINYLLLEKASVVDRIKNQDGKSG